MSVTDKEVITKARIGQSSFREKLIKRDGACCICGLRNEKLLNASHIKPWSKCKDSTEKLNSNNGLLLCSMHDALFDKELITFDENGKIIISNTISMHDKELLGLSDDIHISMSGEMKCFMKWHTEDIYNRITRVFHKKYGEGEILKIEKDSIQIKFINEKGEEEIRVFEISNLNSGTIKRLY